MTFMRVIPVLTLVVVLGSTLVGCEKALFPENTYRSPYDRYAMLRGQYRPAKETSATGAEVPALRERLRPLGQ